MSSNEKTFDALPGQHPKTGQAYDNSAYAQPMGYGQPQGYGHQQGYGQPQGYGPSVAYAQPQGYGQQQANVVINQPQAVVTQPGFRPPDYLVLSIVSCFFCWPMALCAIMYSNNSRSAADRGDMASAISQGRTARNIGIAAIVVSLVIVGVAVGTSVGLASRVRCTYNMYGDYDCTY